MIPRRRCEYLILVAGALILAGGLAHSFLGWPVIRAALAEAGAPADLTAALGIGWNFGGVSMDVFGLIVLASFARLRQGQSAARLPAVLIGAMYVLFGTGAFIHRFPNPHFLFFIIVGLLLTGPALAWRNAAAG